MRLARKLLVGRSVVFHVSDQRYRIPRRRGTGGGKVNWQEPNGSSCGQLAHVGEKDVNRGISQTAPCKAARWLNARLSRRWFRSRSPGAAKQTKAVTKDQRGTSLYCAAVRPAMDVCVAEMRKKSAAEMRNETQRAIAEAASQQQEQVH